jgi:hypothetical protein
VSPIGSATDEWHKLTVARAPKAVVVVVSQTL